MAINEQVTSTIARIKPVPTSIMRNSGGRLRKSKMLMRPRSHDPMFDDLRSDRLDRRSCTPGR